ncbi:roundabout homolog 2 [Eupeodes corollae]|uniref:roundabout homolog 2 n=1 Tax=Eupeodes corollae TaxID=290404 RepID=UPI0024911764|nr:roundabout homolog 2 [Eupeodes corollae]
MSSIIMTTMMMMQTSLFTNKNYWQGSIAMNAKCLCIFMILLLRWSSVEASHPPRITEHPTDTTVPRHEPATLNCKAEGSPTPTIQWYKDGVPLKILPGSHRITLPAGGLFFLKVVNSRRESDAGVYWCEAKNELGVSQSRNATLQVAVLRDEFRLEPQNTRIAQGETALLECAAPRGIPEPIVTWKKGGQKLDLDGNKRIRIVDGGNLAIQEARQSDEGQYQCVAKNPVGVRESVAAILKVHVKPFIIRGPHNQVVLEGSSVTFSCRVGGDPMPDVLWLRTASGGNMPLDRVHVLEDRSLRLERVTLEDEGEYSCEADNVVGSISAVGTLTVHSPPKFAVRPSSKSVDVDSDVSIDCQATGSPSPTIFWSIRGNQSLIFPGNKFNRFEASAIDANGRTTLTVSKLQRTEASLVVICNAINEAGAVSARAQLSIDSQDDHPPPIIIAGPVNQTLPVKSLAVLNCKSIGQPQPTVSWYRDGIPVINSNKINITASGDLVISDLDRNEDQGLYTCVVSSQSGKSTWSGYLRIELPTNPNIKFFRAPEPSKCPSAPGKPKVVSSTNDSVTVAWMPSEKFGASPLLGYAVEMFSTNKSRTWIPLANRLMQTIYTATGLDAGAVYMFIVRAENLLGFSHPSAISESFTAGQVVREEKDIILSEAEALLTANSAVELLEANATDSTGVRLVWDIDSGKFIEGFYIYARDVSSSTLMAGVALGMGMGMGRHLQATSTTTSTSASSGGSYKMLTVLNGGGASACTISGLQKATRYEFFIVPFYKSIEGRPSNAKYATTLEDVPESPPVDMEAISFNKTSVFLKWQPPSNRTANGILTTYNIIVQGLDLHNTTRIFKNMTIDAATPSLLLANLTSGVTYYISVAAANKMGVGPFSQPSVLRMDPRTQSLDTGYTARYPINRDIADDFLTQTWFIVLLGSIIAIIVFLFGAMILFKRYQYIKQTSLGSLHGNHAIGTVRKFPTLPLNANGVWIDPTGGVWRQATSVTTTKDSISDYAPQHLHPTLPLPDYERLTPLNMPDYAEVACSTFKNPNSTLSSMSANNNNHAAITAALYDSCGAYATTNLVANAKLYQNRYATATKANTTAMARSTDNILGDYRATGMYSAPPSAHYGFDASCFNDTNYPMSQDSNITATLGPPPPTSKSTKSSPQQSMGKPSKLGQHYNKQHQSTSSSSSSTAAAATAAGVGVSNLISRAPKMNITENKMDLINNLNLTSSSSTASPSTSSSTTSSSPPSYAIGVLGVSSASAAGASATTTTTTNAFIPNFLNSTSASALSSSSSPSSFSSPSKHHQHQQQQHHSLLNGFKAGIHHQQHQQQHQMVNTFSPTHSNNSNSHNENHHSQVAPECGTMKRNRNPKLFKSDNNINTACNGSSGGGGNNTNSYKNCYSPLLGGRTTAAAATAQPPTTAVHNNDDSYCSSSNHLLLNDYADQFGSKLPAKQHLYVKAKDGTWSAVSSDAYQYKTTSGNGSCSGSGSGSTTNCSERNSNATDTSNNGAIIDDESCRLVSSSKSNINSINCSAGSQKYLTSFGKSDIV